MTSRAWLVDLVHSIGEKLALCDHLAENLEDEQTRELYLIVVEERRLEMQILVNNAPNPNLQYWCSFKHALKSWVLALECYDAQPTEENLNTTKISGNILAGIMSLFLGYQFKTCERCLYDEMLTSNDEKIKKKGVQNERK